MAKRKKTRIVVDLIVEGDPEIAWRTVDSVLNDGTFQDAISERHTTSGDSKVTVRQAIATTARRRARGPAPAQRAGEVGGRVVVTPVACVNCGSARHVQCCARCGKRVPVLRRGLLHCSKKCERAQRREDEASAQEEAASLKEE